MDSKKIERTLTTIIIQYDKDNNLTAIVTVIETRRKTKNQIQVYLI